MPAATTRKSAVSDTAAVDKYLARLGADQRAALERLRKLIRAAAPGAEECISYRMPAFRLDGRMLVWYGAAAKHCAFFPGGMVQEFAGDLEEFSTSKGTVRFQPGTPIPAPLVRRMVKARIAQNAALRAAATRGKKRR